MSNAVQEIQREIAQRDNQDALRIVDAAVTLGAIPGIVSPEARELATTRLRELIHLHPRGAEVFAAIVAHLESYGEQQHSPYRSKRIGSTG